MVGKVGPQQLEAVRGKQLLDVFKWDRKGTLGKRLGMGSRLHYVGGVAACQIQATARRDGWMVFSLIARRTCVVGARQPGRAEARRRDRVNRRQERNRERGHGPSDKQESLPFST